MTNNGFQNGQAVTYNAPTATVQFASIAVNDLPAIGNNTIDIGPNNSLNDGQEVIYHAPASGPSIPNLVDGDAYYVITTPTLTNNNLIQLATTQDGTPISLTPSAPTDASAPFSLVPVQDQPITGLTDGQTYYVTNATTNSFQLAATLAEANSSTYLPISGTDSLGNALSGTSTIGSEGVVLSSPGSGQQDLSINCTSALAGTQQLVGVGGAVILANETSNDGVVTSTVGSNSGGAVTVTKASTSVNHSPFVKTTIGSAGTNIPASLSAGSDINIGSTSNGSVAGISANSGKGLVAVGVASSTVNVLTVGIVDIIAGSTVMAGGNLKVTSNTNINSNVLTNTDSSGLVSSATSTAFAFLDFDSEVQIGSGAVLTAGDTLNAGSATTLQAVTNAQSNTTDGYAAADSTSTGYTKIGDFYAVTATTVGQNAVLTAGNAAGVTAFVKSMNVNSIADSKAGKYTAYANADSHATVDMNGGAGGGANNFTQETTQVLVQPGATIAANTVTLNSSHKNINLSTNSVATATAVDGISSAVANTNDISDSNVTVSTGATIGTGFLQVIADQDINAWTRNVTSNAGATNKAHPHQQGVFTPNREINFNGDISLWNSDNSPSLVIGANGTITSLQGVTVTTDGGTPVGIGETVSTGSIHVQNNNTSYPGGIIDFFTNSLSLQGSPKSTISGSGGTVKIQDALNSIKITNLSNRPLIINNLTAGAPSLQPQATLLADNVPLTFAIAHTASPTAIDIVNQGSGGVVINGLIDNPLGTTSIQSVSGITGTSTGIISSNVVNLNAGLGGVGSASQRLNVDLVKSANLPTGLNVMALLDVWLSLTGVLREPLASVGSNTVFDNGSVQSANVDILLQPSIVEPYVLNETYNSLSVVVPDLTHLSGNYNEFFQPDNGTTPITSASDAVLFADPNQFVVINSTYNFSLVQANTLTGNINLHAADSNRTDPRIDITANTILGASVGGLGTGSVNALTTGNIDITEISGNLRAGKIQSNDGNVTLTSLVGSIVNPIPGDPTNGHTPRVLGYALVLNAISGTVGTATDNLAVESTGSVNATGGSFFNPYNVKIAEPGNVVTKTGTGPVTVFIDETLVTPTITTIAGPNITLTSTTITSLYDGATITGGFDETGTLTFKLVGPDGTTVVDTETVTVNGDGLYATPTGYKLPTTGVTVAGTYQWDVSYSGDQYNNPASDNNDPAGRIVVSPASPTLTAAVPVNTITLGTTSPMLTVSAILSAGYFETGRIYFYLYNSLNTQVDSESDVVSGNGTYSTPLGYTLPTTGTVTGAYHWNAYYLGDSNNKAASDVSDPNDVVTVHAASPTIAGNPASKTVPLGSSTAPLKDAAVLSGGYYETGTITFTLIGPSNTTVNTETVSANGNGTYSTPTGYVLPSSGTVVGAYQWNISYVGDTNNNAASDSNDVNERVTVNPATPTLVGAPVGGMTVTLGANTGSLKDSAVLAGGFHETGTITFTLTGPSNTTIDTETVTVSGNGTYSTPTGYSLPTSGSVVGTYQWNVTYTGDTNNNSARDNNDVNDKVTITPAIPTIAGPGPITITLGASTQTLIGSAILANGYHETGSLTFTLVGPANTTLDTETVTVNGNGTYTTPIGHKLPISGNVTGAYQWNVVYTGDTNNNPVLDSNDPTELVHVNKANPTFTVTPNAPAVLNTGAMMTASAVLAQAYFPTGTVTFTLYNPNNVAVATESGIANGDGTYTTPTGYLPTVAGTYTWVASYSGDVNNNPASGNAPDVAVGPGITPIGSKLYFVGSGTNDDLSVTPIGHSQTGSTGIQVTGDFNGVYFPPTNYYQSFTNFIVVGFGGNDNFQFTKTLTINTTVSDGNGNDTIQLGNGTNTVAVGTGWDTITAGDGTNTVTAGAPGSHGDIQVTLGNGNYDSVTLQGNGNDSVQVGNGSSDVVLITGNGNDSVQVGHYYNYILGGAANGTGDVVQIVGNGNETITTYGDSGKVYLYGTDGLHLTPGWTSMGVSAPTVTYGTSSTVTVTMGSGSGTPTGNVSLSINGGAAILGTLNGSGQVAFNLGNLNAGVYTVSVNYAAQGGFPAMSETGTLTVNQRAVTLTGSRIYDGTNVAEAGILTISDLVGGDNLTLVGGAILASPNAGTEPITSFASLSLGGTSASNYTLVGATGSVTINAVALTFTGSRTYDGTNLVYTPILTFTNLVGGDKVYLNGGGVQLASPNVGPEAITSFGFLGLQGPSASNYTLIGATGTVTINALVVTLTGHRVYDGTNTASGDILNLTNVIGGDNLTLTGSAILASQNVGNELITSFAGLTLGGTSAGNYTLTGATGSVKINALVVTLTGTRTYDGTSTALAGVMTVSDLVSGDHLTLTGSVGLASSNIGNQKIIYFTGLTLSGTSAGNYTLTNATGAVTIAALSVSLTGSRTYDGTTLATASILTVTDLIKGDALSLKLSGSATLAGQYAGVQSITSFAGLSLSGAAASNYTLIGASGYVTINALSVKVTLTGSRVYDGTNVASASILSVANMIGGDNLFLTGSVTLASKNVGLEAITSFAGLSLGGAAASNYTLVGATGSVTIKALAVTLTGNRAYNGTITAAGSILTISDLESGDNVALTGSATLASKNVGSQAITSVVGLVLAGTSAKNYTLVGASGSVTINVLAVTLTGSRPYDGTSTAAANILTVSDLVKGDNLTLTGSATLAGKNAGTEAITSASGLTLGGTSAGNYTLIGATGSVTVKSLAVTLTGSRTYNGANTALAGILTASNLVGGDALTLSGSVTLVSKNVGTEAITSFAGLTLSGIAASNYTLVGANGSVTIKALAVMLTGSRTYDGTSTAAANILAVSNLASGDGLTLSGSVTLDSNNAGTEAITSFAGLTLSGVAASNYTLLTASGSVTIKALSVKLAMTGSRIYDGTNVASASILSVANMVSGDNLTLSGSVTLASKNAGVEAITSFTSLTIGGTAAGNYTLVGTTGSVTINARAVTLTGTRTYDGTSTAVASVLSVSDLVAGDNLTLSGSATLAGRNVGTQAITSFAFLALAGTSVKNYTLAGANGSVTIKALAVTLSGSRTYDGTSVAAASILTVTDLVKGDNLTLTGSATMAGKNAGLEAITSTSGLTMGGTSAGNYTLIGSTGSVTVKALAVTLTGSQTYNGTGTTAASVLTVSDLVNGDNLTLTGSVTLASNNTGTESITSFTGLKLGGASASNYTLVGATGSVMVNPLALTLTLTGTMVSSGTNTAPAGVLIIASSNAVSGDVVTLAGAVTLAGSTSGTQTITSFVGLTLTGLSAKNYVLTVVTGSVKIQ